MATGIKQQDRQDTVAGWLFMSPTLVILGIFMALPIVFALYFSFTDWNGISPPRDAQWVGLANFQELLLQDGIRRADFFKSLKNTFYFSLGVVPLQTIISLALAVVINQRRLRFKDFFRTSYYLPAITSSIAVSMLFLFFYQKNGLINQVLGWLTLGAWEPIAWMSEPQGLFHIILGWFGITLRTGPEWLQTKILSLTVWDWISGPSIALMAIMLMNTWTTIGTMMVIFIAALQDVPTPVYEAAEMDGANGWQTFRKITKAQLDQLMKAEGYSTRRDSDDDIVWTQDGLRWVVFVMSEGTSIQVKFAVGDSKATLERINEWNRGKRYSKSYLDLDGDPNLALDLDLSGGVERARIVDFFRTASISRSAWIKEVFRP